MRRLVAAALAGLLALGAGHAPARADKARSLELFEQGKKKYNLGEFEQAIALFKQAYDEYAAPAYLYNIAQAHRELGDCKKALFFYERFLAEKPTGGHVAKVEATIAELRDECGGKRPPGGGTTGGGTTGGTTGGGTTGGPVAPGADEAPTGAPLPDDAAIAAEDPEPTTPEPTEPATATAPPTGGSVSAAARAPRGPWVVATAGAGAAVADVGDVVVPVTFLLKVGAAYPLRAGGVDLAVGLALDLAPMPYDALDGTATATFVTALAEVAARYPLTAELAVGGALGVGGFVVPALELGNPFAEGGRATERATTLALRAGALAEYALSPALAVEGGAAVARAGAPDDFRDAIGAVVRLELLAGVRYLW